MKLKKVKAGQLFYYTKSSMTDHLQLKLESDAIIQVSVLELATMHTYEGDPDYECKVVGRYGDILNFEAINRLPTKAESK